MRRRMDDTVRPDSTDTLQPDVISYRNGKLYVVGRGSNPVSAVVPDYFKATALAGLYTFTVTNCQEVSVEEDDVVLLADKEKSVHIAPDTHGGDLVNDEFWIVDQSGSGFVLDCTSDDRASYYVGIEAMRNSN